MEGHAVLPLFAQYIFCDKNANNRCVSDRSEGKEVYDHEKTAAAIYGYIVAKSSGHYRNDVPDGSHGGMR